MRPPTGAPRKSPRCSHGSTPEVSKVIGSVSPVRYDGRNTDTTGSPSVGDAVYLDPDDNVRFISWKNLVPGALGNGWYPVGVVINRKGRKVRIRYKYYKSSKTADPMVYKINSQSSSSITFTVPDTANGTTTVALGVTFTATKSLSSEPTGFIAELDAWLRAHQPGQNGLPGIVLTWHAEYINNTPYIICDTTNTKNDVNVSSSGLSISIQSFYMAPESYYSSLPTNYGYNLGHGLICNTDTLLAFGGTVTPTSNVNPAVSGSPVNRDSFNNSQYCETLRSTFSTYEAYLDSRCLACPTQKHGYFSAWNNRSYELSVQMAKYTYPDINGNIKPYFKAIVWSLAPCEDANRASAVNAAFKWHMPDVIEMYEYLHGRGSTTDDPVWSTMGKIGDSHGTISNLRNVYAINSWKDHQTQWKESGLWSLTYDGGNHERHRTYPQLSFADYDLTGRT